MPTTAIAPPRIPPRAGTTGLAAPEEVAAADAEDVLLAKELPAEEPAEEPDDATDEARDERLEP
jgi:hypothetical protein